MVGVVGTHGQLIQIAILRNPETKYKRLKNIFAVTCFVQISARIFMKLLQPLVQSVVPSPVRPIAF